MADRVFSWTDGEKKESKWTRARDEEATTESSTSKSKISHLSHLTKRLKAIYEEEGLDFGDDPIDETTIVDRFTVANKLRRKRVTEVFRSIRRSRNVELCFLMDATGSMQPHINGVRESIGKIVDTLISSATPEVQDLKLAFVAYRDHGDSLQFETLNFTKSVSDFQDFCSRIVASGGGDVPEDVFGGLEKAMDLNWSENAGTKVIFHICDAPCHGKEFHETDLRDSYPSGDPKGRTHTALFSRLGDLGLQYHFGKINNSTNQMIVKFAEAYGNQIVEFGVQKVEDIAESVSTAVSISVSTSILVVSTAVTTALPGKVKRHERTFQFDKEEPAWPSLAEEKGKFISYDFPASIKDVVDDVPLTRRHPKSATVKIAVNPFARGAERVAFYGLDLSTFIDEKLKVEKQKMEPIVLKEYIRVGDGMNSGRRYELSNQMQTIADYMAREFSKELQEKCGHSTATLKFLKIKTLLITSSTGNRFMSCERRFSREDEFVRFSNNACYQLTEKKAMEKGVPIELLQQIMAFSHWTYKATNGFLMVVDLEGIVSKELSTSRTNIHLTDPAIHCKDHTRYGRMNHGTVGMKEFFVYHKCNRFCSILGLEATFSSNDDSD